MICRDLEVATNVARTSEVDCITLDGRSLYLTVSRSRVTVGVRSGETPPLLLFDFSIHKSLVSIFNPLSLGFRLPSHFEEITE